MFLSLTGFAYLILFASLSFLIFRFFQIWREEKTTTTKLFLFVVSCFALYALVRTVSVFFFIENPQALIDSKTIVTFFQSLAAAIVAYLIFYLKLPNQMIILH